MKFIKSKNGARIIIALAITVTFIISIVCEGDEISKMIYGPFMFVLGYYFKE